ncbi:hypothetical protein GCM10018781_61020 [Kitasatospora indigofera]|uniref:Uncharacterized protein n=1 Tax=Kitasatospora indigofera TaxID=67307 RepID=A0A919GAA4_9ACTN|nr:hypothetical protein [Kitasatospora indigofera]GHH80478.1 hypothetical protein GCM10018781_61020 [Kitasatospora indigofera]
MSSAFEDIAAEQEAIRARWGEQHHPTGAHRGFAPLRRLLQYLCDRAARRGRKTWRHILVEEVLEVLAEPDDPQAMRAELVQVGAVVVAMIDDLDRN